MTEGSHVRIANSKSLKGRTHVMEHARARDVGQVAGSATPFASVDKLYVRVKFPNCRITHRFLREELELVP